MVHTKMSSHVLVQQPKCRSFSIFCFPWSEIGRNTVFLKTKMAQFSSFLPFLQSEIGLNSRMCILFAPPMAQTVIVQHSLIVFNIARDQEYVWHFISVSILIWIFLVLIMIVIIAFFAGTQTMQHFKTSLSWWGTCGWARAKNIFMENKFYQ